MEPEKYILTVDLGTSGPKVALFTTGGESLAYEFERVSLILKPNGGAEQDPLEWWNAMARASRRKTQSDPGNGSEQANADKANCHRTTMRRAIRHCDRHHRHDDGTSP